MERKTERGKGYGKEIRGRERGWKGKYVDEEKGKGKGRTSRESGDNISLRMGWKKWGKKFVVDHVKEIGERKRDRR